MAKKYTPHYISVNQLVAIDKDKNDIHFLLANKEIIEIVLLGDKAEFWITNKRMIFLQGKQFMNEIMETYHSFPYSKIEDFVVTISDKFDHEMIFNSTNNGVILKLDNNLPIAEISQLVSDKIL
ncbi:MAG: PH domain-containing protein [Saprospiraceae bacterium]